jgi:uncharacterized damage-inducible protein DinB
MLPAFEPLLKEIKEEAVITKRVLDRVPADKLTWKPHEKSMSLGQLAFHVASIPGGLAKGLQQDQVERPATAGPAADRTLEEIHSTFSASLSAIEECIRNMSEESAKGNWRLMIDGKTLISRPRAEVLRSVVCNHMYHHRGQLSVYLRLLDVPVPIIYGRSADESPAG